MDTQLSSRSHPVIGPLAPPLAPVPLFLANTDDFLFSRRYCLIDGRGLKHIGAPVAFRDTSLMRNICQGAILATRHGHGGQAYFLTDGDPPITFRQFLTGLLATQGVKPGSASLPRWLAWSMAAVMEGLPLPWAPPITRDQLALIGGEVTVCDSKARRELGYRSHASRTKGLEELAV